jgi:hypothetical protein
MPTAPKHRCPRSALAARRHRGPPGANRAAHRPGRRAARTRIARAMNARTTAQMATAGSASSTVAASSVCARRDRLLTSAQTVTADSTSSSVSATKAAPVKRSRRVTREWLEGEYVNKQRTLADPLSSVKLSGPLSPAVEAVLAGRGAVERIHRVAQLPGHRSIKEATIAMGVGSGNDKWPTPSRRTVRRVQDHRPGVTPSLHPPRRIIGPGSPSCLGLAARRTPREPRCRRAF